MAKSSAGPVKAPATAKPRRWRFTADQYQRMGELGVFHPEDRVELLDGDLYQMAALGSWHNAEVDTLNMHFAPAVVGRAIVRVQGSFRLSTYSEPEPDLLVLKFRPDFYRAALPGPQDVMLLVEVSDSSLAHDRNRKLPLYARDGIPEVWIIIRREQLIEVYREPAGDRYRSVTINELGTSVAPLGFPELAVSVAEVFGEPA